MKDKIIFIFTFSLGYYTGQFKHGWKFLLWTVVIMLVEVQLVALFSRIWKKKKIHHELDLTARMK